MKRKNIKRLFCLLAVSCLLSGCAGNKKNEEIINTMKSTAVVNDFKITLFTEKAEYEDKELKGEKKPFDYKLVLEYIGEKENETIWHESSIGGISLLNPEGECIVENLYFSIAQSSILNQNISITVDEWNGKREIEETGELEKGVYTVKAYVGFSAGEDFDDKEHLKKTECVLNLPLVIR